MRRCIAVPARHCCYSAGRPPRTWGEDCEIPLLEQPQPESQIRLLANCQRQDEDGAVAGRHHLRLAGHGALAQGLLSPSRQEAVFVGATAEDRRIGSGIGGAGIDQGDQHRVRLAVVAEPQAQQAIIMEMRGGRCQGRGARVGRSLHGARADEDGPDDRPQREGEGCVVRIGGEAGATAGGGGDPGFD